MILKTLLASATLALACASASAGPHFIISKDHLTIMIPQGLGPQLPVDFRGKKNGGIFNNFAGKYKDGLYDCCLGQYIIGSGGLNPPQSWAIAFTPAKSKSVKNITVAL